MAEEATDTCTYQVVVDDEERYAIRLPDREPPPVRRADGTRGAGLTGGTHAHV
ncbi:hypothetical protein ACFUJ0_02330 [Streptomyces sp. NPDC057242]|uniref:hypothetical protein n=1 Tax=unclassified Streptomyces TaxID=2593676 RepID=UPI00362C38BF